jgi:uridine kinase
VRIAISGTHFSGKSTLVGGLSDALPTYSIVEEPYVLLAEEGYEFAEMLQDILLEDSFDFDVEVIEVTGARDERVRRVMAHLGPSNACGPG